VSAERRTLRHRREPAAPHQLREQVGDPVLEHLVGGQAARVLEAHRLQVLVHVRQAKAASPRSNGCGETEAASELGAAVHITVSPAIQRASLGGQEGHNFSREIAHERPYWLLRGFGNGMR
jgi:hypothetical protein